MGRSSFGRGVFEFLNELEANNEKAWWEANKPRYAEQIREPALEFVTAFERRLHKISAHFVADPRINGGSLMRPYRDVRFSPDKTPYKTNVGIMFRHEAGGDVHAPGFYLHLEPGSCFAGIGLWHPEPKVARVLRVSISDNPSAWGRAAHSAGFTKVWDLDTDDEMLKRVPKELDAEHPYADDLRLKSFVAGSQLTQRVVTSADFETELARRYRAGSRFMAFLCASLDLPY